MDDRYDPTHPRHRELMLPCCSYGTCEPTRCADCQGPLTPVSGGLWYCDTCNVARLLP